MIANYQIMDMEVGNVQRNKDEGNIMIFKAPLHKILQNPQHVDRYREVICNINTIIYQGAGVDPPGLVDGDTARLVVAR